MTAQEVFSKVYKALLAQGGPSHYDGGCCYRMTTDDGESRMCAVGHLIPNELYKTELEGLTVSFGIVADVLRTAGYGEHVEMLGHLQHIHDDAILENAEDFTGTQKQLDALWLAAWMEQMEKYAQEHNLYIPVV